MKTILKIPEKITKIPNFITDVKAKFSIQIAFSKAPGISKPKRGAYFDCGTLEVHGNPHADLLGSRDGQILHIRPSPVRVQLWDIQSSGNSLDGNTFKGKSLFL